MKHSLRSTLELSRPARRAFHAVLLPAQSVQVSTLVERAVLAAHPVAPAVPVPLGPIKARALPVRVGVRAVQAPQVVEAALSGAQPTGRTADRVAVALREFASLVLEAPVAVSSARVGKRVRAALSGLFGQKPAARVERIRVGVWKLDLETPSPESHQGPPAFQLRIR